MRGAFVSISHSTQPSPDRACSSYLAARCVATHFASLHSRPHRLCSALLPRPGRRSHSVLNAHTHMQVHAGVERSHGAWPRLCYWPTSPRLLSALAVLVASAAHGTACVRVCLSGAADADAPPLGKFCDAVLTIKPSPLPRCPPVVAPVAVHNRPPLPRHAPLLRHRRRHGGAAGDEHIQIPPDHDPVETGWTGGGGAGLLEAPGGSDERVRALGAWARGAIRRQGPISCGAVTTAAVLAEQRREAPGGSEAPLSVPCFPFVRFLQNKCSWKGSCVLDESGLENREHPPTARPLCAPR